MSYSMLEPEWEPVCECRYDEVHDRMDREDCLRHCDMDVEVSLPQEWPQPEPENRLKKSAAVAKRDEENAA